MLSTRLVAGTTAGFVMSAVFATVLVIINSADVLFEPLRVDPAQPAPITLRLPPTTLRENDPETGMPRLTTQAPVIGRGETVSSANLAELVELYEASRRPVRPEALIGLWLIYFLLAMTLTRYLRIFSPSRGALLRTQVGVLTLTLAILAVSKAFLLLTAFSPFFIPAAAMPLWISLYLDRRTAFISSIMLSVLSSSLLGFNLATMAVQLASGVAASLLLWDRKHAMVFVYGGLSAALAAFAVIAAGKLISHGGIDIAAELIEPGRSDLVSGLLGGAMAGAVALFLREPVVQLLGAVSRGRLLDLTDLDQPLLRKMANEAPGSWEHSRAMANLAEEASAAIGADPLLTRVGAYYHDLGKSCQAKLFVENLARGERSPHEDLDPDVSADAIMAHVIEGVRILRKDHIPEPVVEFAYTHHGTTTIEYFWNKCLAQGNPKGLTEAYFKYPGMKPRTKETAILMLIDSIEAAGRTIHPPEREAFEIMVQRIIYTKLRQGQLDESGLTLEDLRILTTRIADALVSIHHARIRYPWQDQKQDQKQSENQNPDDPPAPREPRPEITGERIALEINNKSTGANR